MNFDNDIFLNQALSIPIMDVLNYYEVPLSGRKINCLWHEDGTPSAHIYEDTNLGYCFGCSRASFSSIDIVMLKEGLPFNEAIEFLLSKENKFNVNDNFVVKQKNNLKQYYAFNDGIRKLVKDGADINMIRHYCQIVDMNNNKERIICKIDYTIKIKIKEMAENESKGNGLV